MDNFYFRKDVPRHTIKPNQKLVAYTVKSRVGLDNRKLIKSNMILNRYSFPYNVHSAWIIWTWNNKKLILNLGSCLICDSFSQLDVYDRSQTLAFFDYFYVRSINDA